MRIFVLLLVFLPLLLPAQVQVYNKAVIWRGFQHSWTYNHRCNRVGDYVVYNNGKPQAAHISATGLGPDSTYFTSHYTYIESPDLAFKEGKVNFRIDGKERELIEGSVLVHIQADDWMQNKAAYSAIINGFDLKSTEGADKMQLFRLAIEDPAYIPGNRELQFRVNYSMVLNCQSAECSKSNNRVSYSFDVYYLLVGTNEYSTKATEQFFTRSYSWDKKEEVSDRPEEKSVDGVAMPIYEKATLGLKAFSVVLNEAHWLLQMNVNVTPVEYNPPTGDMRFSIDLLYKEWQDGMRGSKAAPQSSQFAARRKGWVLLDADVLLLQMRTAEIRYMNRSGKMFWRGFNHTPEGKEAVNVSEIELD